MQLGVSLRSLAPLIGISVASLFGYRSGSIQISPKAWSKLERQENLLASKKVADNRSDLVSLAEDGPAYRVSESQRAMAEKMIEMRGQIRDLNLKLDELTTMFIEESKNKP